MAEPIIRLSELQPLDRLRVRLRGAYNGTITEPGTLVSDGKVIVAWQHVVAEQRPLVEEVARVDAADRRLVTQEEAHRLFAMLGRRRSVRAQVLGQIEKPLWINASSLDRVALLRYGRGRNAAYLLLDAYRLLLLDRLTAPDEIRCEGPGGAVALRRRGEVVAGMTALPVVPMVEP